jgi:hypothetical protein
MYLVFVYLATHQVLTLPEPANFSGVESAEITCVTPRLVKGKNVELIPKGSTKAKEIAKENWFGEFFFFLIPELKKWKGFGSARTLTG